MFYTYIWLREKDWTPYYVGKGSGRRAFDSSSHGVKCPKDKARIFVQYWGSEEKAFEMEKWWISFWGRKDVGTGILRNLTDGGENPPNDCSEETNRKRSESMRKAYAEGRHPSGFQKGKDPWNKGLVGAYKASEETRVRISLATREALGIRMADCHPDRKHKALGLCISCYTTRKRRERKQNGRQQAD